MVIKSLCGKKKEFTFDSVSIFIDCLLMIFLVPISHDVTNCNLP